MQLRGVGHSFHLLSGQRGLWKPALPATPGRATVLHASPYTAFLPSQGQESTAALHSKAEWTRPALTHTPATGIIVGVTDDDSLIYQFALVQSLSHAPALYDPREPLQGSSP